MITFQEFVNRHNGKFEEYNNDKYKFQCMDLFWLYLKEVVGIDPKPYQGWGNPKNVWNNFLKITDASKNFEKIPNVWNDLNCQSKRGDIIFWGFYPGVTGWNGHVAICSGAGAKTIISFDQNYPTGSFCKYVNHSYRGVLGWLRPKAR
jgi:cell wall-associated NlpC family hydrolase